MAVAVLAGYVKARYAISMHRANYTYEPPLFIYKSLPASVRNRTAINEL